MSKMMSPLELSRMAANVEAAFTDTFGFDSSLLKSAYRYRHELAALEQRDKAAGMEIPTPWTNDVSTGKDDDPDYPLSKYMEDTIEHMDDALDGICAVLKEVQGKSAGDLLKPWMVAGLKAEERKKIEVRAAGHAVEGAFIASIGDLASYLRSHWFDIPYDDQEEGAEAALKLSNGMYLEEHLDELCFRIDRLESLHDQWDVYAPYQNEWGPQNEAYEQWLRQEILRQLDSSGIRTTVSAAIKKGASLIKAADERMQRVMDEDENTDNVVKLRP